MLVSAIAGFMNLPPDGAAEQQMLAAMEQRGRGQRTVVRTAGGTLLQLAPAGPARTEEAVLLFDGSLYNGEQLRRELRQLGRFPETEEETVLQCFLAWGPDCLLRLEGAFALAVQREGQLFLARDPLGLRPLFYSLHRGGLVFGSEMKTVLAYPTVEARIGEEGVAELLLMGPGRTPGCGVFADIRGLKPGQWAVYREGRLTVRRYWRLQDRVHTQTLEETAEQVRALVTASIRQQMTETAGACLSGGLDSSLICAVCAEALHSRGSVLSTFSVDYSNQARYFRPNAFQPNEDRYYIGLMQQALHSRHRTVILTPEQLAGQLEEAMLARDLPGMGDVDASLLLLCRQIRREVPVALSGEGADEIFGGYPWYRDRQAGFPWARNTAQRLALLSGQFRRDRLEDYVQQRWRQAMEDCDVLPEQPEEEKAVKRMMNLNLFWFMQTLAERNDRMSARAGLEMRVPLCTPEIAQYLYAVPWAMKQEHGREKGLLRRAVRDLLPGEVLWRKKSPYPKTFDPRFGQLMLEEMQKLLERKDAALFEIADRQALAALVREETETPWYGQLMRRPQTIAYFLQMQAWMEAYRVDVIS